MHNKTTEQVLIGSILGDGSIDKYGRYTESHCFRQKDYLFWKKRVFDKQFKGISFRYCYWITHGKRSRFCYLSVPRNEFFEKYRKLCYPNGKKIISNEFIKKIGKKAIVTWYFDDGGHNLSTNTIILSSYGFSFDENQKLQRMLKNRFGLNFYIQRHKRTMKYLYSLNCSGKNTDKFLRFIKKNALNIPKSLIYKLGKFDKRNEKLIKSSLKSYKNRTKSYYQENKNRIIKSSLDYYSKNKRKIIELHKEYKKKNKIRYQELDRRYRKKNRKRLKKYFREYRKNNREMLRKKDKEYYRKNKKYIRKYQKKYYLELKRRLKKR